MTTTERPAQLAVLPDPSGLLAAIMSQPDDDTVRLAFADWLDEQDVVNMPCPTCSPYADDPCPRCDGKKTVWKHRSEWGESWGKQHFGGSDPCHECSGTGKFPPGYHPQRDPASGRHEGGWTNCQTCWRSGTPGVITDTTNNLRAEYIRLFISNNRNPSDVPIEDLRRCNALYPLVFGRYGFKTGVAEPGMGRGFIYNVETSWDWWAQNGDKLREQEWVPRVKLPEVPNLNPVMSDQTNEEMQTFVIRCACTVAGKNFSSEVEITRISLEACREFGANGIPEVVNAAREKLTEAMRPERVLAARYPGTVFTFARM